MKNAGIAGGLVAIGFGLTTIGLSNFQSTPQAVAAAPVAAAVEQGPEEPTIVWYGTGRQSKTYDNPLIYRAWSNGTLEVKVVALYGAFNSCAGVNEVCTENNWIVISSPTEGMNAAADINFDEIVDGADLAMLLGKWGDAPRNPMPPSDCPLGLLNPS